MLEAMVPEVSFRHRSIAVQNAQVDWFDKERRLAARSCGQLYLTVPSRAVVLRRRVADVRKKVQHSRIGSSSILRIPLLVARMTLASWNIVPLTIDSEAVEQPLLCERTCLRLGLMTSATCPGYRDMINAWGEACALY